MKKLISSPSPPASKLTHHVKLEGTISISFVFSFWGWTWEVADVAFINMNSL
jgi:hypothetical protein